ncbi:hypothetical protein EAG_03278, partial [Camponotus floridanus]
IPSRTILITFKGQILPDHVCLYMIRHSITPFVTKTSLCFKCFRFGHIGAQRKGHARCIDCKEARHGDDGACSRRGSALICINCGGPHRASDFSSEYSFQSRIREFSAYENVPLSD